MSTPDLPTRGPARPGPYIAAGILLAISVLVPLFVPAYAIDKPPLFGMPFFYWYQMLWVPITAGLIGISYRLVTKEDQRRRTVARSARAEEQEP